MTKLAPPAQAEARRLAAVDARDVLHELAEHPHLADAYTLRAVAKRLGRGYAVTQRLFDPLSGRALSEHQVVAIGAEFATRFYRRRLARLASTDVKPASDPRFAALSLTVGLGAAAEEAEKAMADQYCSAAEWRAVASKCGAIAGNAARAEAACLAAAARADVDNVVPLRRTGSDR